jgi:hypothetical protein
MKSPGLSNKMILRSMRPTAYRLLCILFLFLGLGMGASLAHAADWTKTETPHFSFHTPNALSGRIKEIQKTAESSYQIVTRQLGLQPPGRIPVYLYSEHRDFRAAAGIQPHDLIVGTSGSRDGLIRLDASGAFEEPEGILLHEIVHSVLARTLEDCLQELPLWMNEGLAQIVGQPENLGAEERVRQVRGEGRLRPLSELSVEFPHGEDSEIAYAEAYSATAYFIQLNGWQGLRRLLKNLEGGEGFSASFRDASGDELGDFYQGWEWSLVRHGWRAWVQLFFAPASTLVMLYAAWIANRRIARHRRKIVEDEKESPEDADPQTEDAPSNERPGLE